MIVCIDCPKEFLTHHGMRSHWTQVHNPERKVIDRSGKNNPHFGHKGRNQFSDRILAETPWDKLGFGFKRRFLIQEANHSCTQCGYNRTRENGKSILEIDHIDGNHLNNQRSNLRVLCPNCHALTPNFRNWGRSRKSGKTSTRFRKGNVGFLSKERK